MQFLFAVDVVSAFRGPYCAMFFRKASATCDAIKIVDQNQVLVRDGAFLKFMAPAW